MFFLILLFFIRYHSAMINLYNEIIEETTLGTEVLSVSHELKRNGHDYTMTGYSFILDKVDTDYRFFKMEQNDGRLIVHERIDRETICQPNNNHLQMPCILNILGSVYRENQVSVNQLIQRFNITLNIVDINDNSPECPINSVQRIEVREDFSIGQSIVKWKVTDMDTRPNAIQSIELIPEKDGPFRVDITSMGEPPWTEVIADIRAAQSLDNLNGLFNSYLIISDGKQKSNCTLQVVIIDVNNNAPVWRKPLQFVSSLLYTMEIYEGQLDQPNGLVQFEADDQDSQYNAEIIYELVGEDNLPLNNDNVIRKHFHLDPFTGWLTIKTHYPIDYELLSKDFDQDSPGQLSIYLNISARDNPKVELERKFSPIGRMLLKIIDINDNSPKVRIIGQFNSKSPLYINQMASVSYEVIEVPENLPVDSLIATIHVSDEDSDAFQAVQCNLYDTNETMQQYNTHESLTGHSRYFKLVDNEKLLTMVEIDREYVNAYWLSLICSDNEKRTQTYPPGSMVKKTQILLRVSVLDLNDNQPEFDYSTSLDGKSFVFEMEEHPRPGAKIAQLKYYDRDSGEASHHIWTLDAGQNSIFILDKTTGWLTISKNVPQDSIDAEIDRELHNRIQFSVILKDYLPNQQVLTEPVYQINTSLTLIIIDVNDNAPEVDPLILLSVEENSEPDRSIGFIHARDSDQVNTPNSALAFRIVYDNNQHNNQASSEFDLAMFVRSFELAKRRSRVNLPEIKLDASTGELRVGKQPKIDRERRKKYDIIVEISDGNAVNKNSSKDSPTIPGLLEPFRKYVYTRVIISVLDVNDNRPRFNYHEDNRATLKFSCDDVDKVPAVVAQINATDIDDDSQLMYTLEVIEEARQLPIHLMNSISRQTLIRNHFIINEHSGELTLLDFDKEHVPKFCEKFSQHDLVQVLRINASDGLYSVETFVTIKFLYASASSNGPSIMDQKQRQFGRPSTKHIPETVSKNRNVSSRMFWIAAICLSVATVILLILILGVCFVTLKPKESRYLFQTSQNVNPNMTFNSHQQQQTLDGRQHYYPQLQEISTIRRKINGQYDQKQKLQTANYNQLYHPANNNQLTSGYLTTMNNLTEARSLGHQITKMKGPLTAYEALTNIANNTDDNCQQQCCYLTTTSKGPIHTFREGGVCDKLTSNQEQNDEHQLHMNDANFIRLDRNESSFV